MTESIKEFATSVFGDCPWLAVILVAMIPIIELRGAIPFAMSASFWGAAALPWWQAYLFAVIGTTIPALFIIPLLKPFFGWLKKTRLFKKFVEFFETRFVKKGEGISEKAASEKSSSKKRKAKFWGVLIFVAVPFPLTGAWTGSAIASYLNMKFGDGVLAVFIGNLVAGALMTIVCVLFPGFENIIFYSFLGLVAIVLVVSFVWWILKKTKKVEKISSGE